MQFPDRDEPDNSTPQPKKKFRLSHLGFSIFEKRAIWLLVLLLIIGSSYRLYKHYRLSEQLSVKPSAHNQVVSGSAYNQEVEASTRIEKIDINHAGLSDLIKLPNIGPKKAQAIIEYRSSHGSFNDVSDLMKVYGIGEKTLKALENMVMVGDTARKTEP